MKITVNGELVDYYPIRLARFEIASTISRGAEYMMTAAQFEKIFPRIDADGDGYSVECDNEGRYIHAPSTIGLTSFEMFCLYENAFATCSLEPDRWCIRRSTPREQGESVGAFVRRLEHISDPDTRASLASFWMSYITLLLKKSAQARKLNDELNKISGLTEGAANQ